jgi:hypothetical protein
MAIGRIGKIAFGVAAAALFSVAGVLIYSATGTDAMISGNIERVLATARSPTPPRLAEPDMTELPEPVRRYFHFAFPDGPRALRAVRMELSGDFRRPGSTSWAPMTVEQYVSVVDPAFVFFGDTDVLPGVWARAMDSYVDGAMHMNVRLLSAITVLNEIDVPELNLTSLMRFFIEAPLFPSALLPNRHLRWEPIDGSTARAVVSKDGREVGAYRVTFDDAGRIVRYDAEKGGRKADEARFHGAGEVALRGDYRTVDGVMVPMSFQIARRIDGQMKPFWKGRVERIEFDRMERFR